LPSQSPATSDCLRFVFRSFGVDELMAVYGTHRCAGQSVSSSAVGG
jgi:hypothetical protein